MTQRIFRSIVLAVMAVLLASLSVLTALLYNYFSDVQKGQLRSELQLAVQGVEMNGIDYLAALTSEDEYRLTWVDPDGMVLFDSQVPADTMDNHLDREEIREAMTSRTGESERYSSTLTQTTLYFAARLENGTVLRISAAQASVLTLLLGMLSPLAGVLLLAILFSFLLARRMAKRIVEPLNDLDLDNPLENDAYPEISPLLNRISRQHRQINAQLIALKRQTDQFEQITRYMNEGLVVIDDKRTVLSINPAARALFEADADCVGKDFLTIDRSTEMDHAMQKALEGAHSEFRAQRKKGVYQFDISRIESDGVTLGAVLLAFDVSEQANAERNRQEFTANVSHELKTPLQTIIGSAELLESGLVKAEDFPRFVGHIHAEAARLVTLINDIIRLSQLEENAELPSETVDIAEVCSEVMTVLTPSAEKKNVSLSFSGYAAPVFAVRRYIYEILYNLCDNAIRYNRDGGSVTVELTETSGDTVVSVTDTGIGIPQEHQARIFERFYRVDKSHSRETGGTGLGLSIVKHAVASLGGQLKLVSTPGIGTTITVIFRQNSNKKVRVF